MVLVAHITSEKNKSSILEKGIECQVYKDSRSIYNEKCGVFFRPFDDPKYNALELLNSESDNYRILHSAQKELSLQKEINECDLDKKTPLQIKFGTRYIDTLTDQVKKAEEDLHKIMILIDIPESDIKIGDGENEPYKETESYENYKNEDNMLYPEIFIERNIKSDEILGILNHSTIYNMIAKCGNKEECIKDFLKR